MSKESNPSAAAPGAAVHLSALLDELAGETGIERNELADMLAAIERGETFADFLGADGSVLASIENAAVSFYRSNRYQDAENIFALLGLLANGTRASAFRGIAACRQVALDFEGAIANYVSALTLDPSDLLSAVHLAECLLMTEQDSDAHKLLTSILEDAERQGIAKEPHIRRASALLHARPDGLPGSTPPRPLKKEAVTEAKASHQTNPRAHGGAPSLAAPTANARKLAFGPAQSRTAEQTDKDSARAGEIVQQPRGSTEQTEADASGLHDGDDMPPAPKSDDPEVVAFLARPHVKERLDELAEMYRSGAITLRDIADFDAEQIDAGYAVCYKLLELKNYPKCLEMCGWMMHIDSHDPRFYQLSGLCAMNLGLLCLAEYLFACDTIWRKDGPEPATLIYQAECLCKQEEIASGRKMAREGLKLATGRPGYAEIVKRGQLLLDHYAEEQSHE